MTFHWNSISAASLWCLAYLVFFGSILAFTCYSWLFRFCKPSHVATYAYVNPIVAVLLGYFLANEPMNERTFSAAAFIIAGVILVTARKRRKRQAAIVEEEPFIATAAQELSEL